MPLHPASPDVVSGSGTFSTQQAAPATASILAGYQSFTSTTAATTLITIPAGKTWIGMIGASVDCAIAAASSTAGQALAVFTTAGANATPAAGTYFAVEARGFGITSVQLMANHLPGAQTSKYLVEADVPIRWRAFRWPMPFAPSSGS